MIEGPPPFGGIDKDVYNNIIIFLSVVIGFEKNLVFLPSSAD